ncbi:MAG: signal recognition particle protein [Alphaproteobacteria bacterium]|nr:signal recognition particle protein [Alphaproteobacteria bacterium]
MFDNLSNRLGNVFEKLKRRGSLSAKDVEEAMRDIRVALLEADVALPVVKDFIEGVKERAVGEVVLKSITPGQMVVKIVNDRLVELLGGEAVDLNLAGSPPQVLLMVGLQGSGKTTTSAKIAHRLKTKERRKVLLASLDVQRPAAQQQLQVLADQTGVAGLPVVLGQQPVEIATRAKETAAREGIDVVILDTAGRLHIDDALMVELEAVRDKVNPHETLLVADSLTGQDAVHLAKSFHERIGISGIVLTRMDGDARGGAALSMRAVTGQPIKLVGMGEKIDELEAFHPERVASRILGMGDVVSLVEKVAETVDQDEAEALAARMQKGKFDLDDLATQLRQMTKMGGMNSILGMLPGIGKMQKQMAEAKIDDKMIGRQLAILSSMTPKERKNPQILHASRKKRIAAGSGTQVQDVNKLMKQYQQMQTMMKRMKKAGGMKNLMGRMGGMGGMGGGGMPPGGLPPGMLGR